MKNESARFVRVCAAAENLLEFAQGPVSLDATRTEKLSSLLFASSHDLEGFDMDRHQSKSTRLRLWLL